MPTYTVRAPDGHTIELQGPAGASHEQVLAMAQKLYQPKAAQPAQSGGAVAGEPDLGPLNGLVAGGVSFVHNLPFVGDAAITAGRAANDAMSGRGFDWQRANKEAQETVASAQQQHPVASLVGGVAGAGDAALVGGGALKAADLAPEALALKSGQPLLNAGRMALAGATQGAAQAGGSQLAGGHVAEAVPAAAGGAATGAVGGAVMAPVGGAAVAAARRFAPLAAKTALALSKVFGESPGDLQAAWTQFTDATGRAPTMAELASLKQQGRIATAAKNSDVITGALRESAAAQAQARSTAMRQSIGSLDPQASGVAENVRTAQGDADYTASRAAPDFNIPTEPSDELGGDSPADHLAAHVLPQAGLGKADRVRIMADLQSGKLSSQDAQLMRSGLNDSLNRNFSPATKGFLADFDAITHAAGNEEPAGALDTATANYAANSRRMEGAAHGESVLGGDTAANYAATAAAKPNANPEFAQGMEAGAASKLTDEAATPEGSLSLARRLATDDSLYAKLKVAVGGPTADAMRRIGSAESEAAASLAPYRSRLGPDEETQQGHDAHAVVHGAAALGAHGPWGVYHAARAIQGLGLRMSPKVQEKVAQYLSDPSMTQQGINLLRRSGATLQMIRQVALAAAAATGGVANSHVQPPESQP